MIAIIVLSQSVTVLLIFVLYYGWLEHDLHIYLCSVLTVCDSPTLLYLPLGESTCGPTALMGYCIHFCVAVIICILVLIGIYLDVLIN